MNFTIKENVSVLFSEGKLVINTKQKFVFLEIVIYSLTAFLFFFLTNFIVATLITFFVFITYFVFRVISVAYYSIIIFDFNKKEIVKESYRGNEIVDSKLITNRLETKNIIFKEIIRSGKTKYLLSYKSYKEIELVLIKEKEDYLEIKTIIDKNFI